MKTLDQRVVQAPDLRILAPGHPPATRKVAQRLLVGGLRLLGLGRPLGKLLVKLLLDVVHLRPAALINLRLNQRKAPTRTMRGKLRLKQLLLPAADPEGVIRANLRYLLQANVVHLRNE